MFAETMLYSSTHCMYPFRAHTMRCGADVSALDLHTQRTEALNKCHPEHGELHSRWRLTIIILIDYHRGCGEWCHRSFRRESCNPTCCTRLHRDIENATSTLSWLLGLMFTCVLGGFGVSLVKRDTSTRSVKRDDDDAVPQ